MLALAYLHQTPRHLTIPAARVHTAPGGISQEPTRVISDDQDDDRGDA